METQSNQPTTQPDLEKQNRKDLSAYRRRLWGLIAISSGIDAVMFVGDLIALPFSMGSSFVVDEIIEFFLSILLAKNKMRLKRRYNVVGLLPIPCLTSLTVQALLEMRKSYKKPEEILERLAEPVEE